MRETSVYLNSRVHHSTRRIEGTNSNSLPLKLLPVIAGRSTVPRSGLPALNLEVWEPLNSLR